MLGPSLRMRKKLEYSPWGWFDDGLGLKSVIYGGFFFTISPYF